MFIKVNGVRLFYEKMGSGPAMIMVHGNEEDHRIFDDASELLKKNYTLYLVDSRGHGQSDRVKEYFYQDMCDDMVELIEQLQLQDITFVGSSDGAIIGMLLASQHPDIITNLVLAGPNTRPDGVIPEVYREMKDIYRKTKNPLVKMMLEQPHITNKELKQIKARTLVLAGSDDLISLDHIKKIANHIPHCQLMILEGEDHSSYIIHSEKIAKIILEKLK